MADGSRKRGVNDDTAADDPLGALERVVDRARQIEPVEVVEPPREDPIEKLESLMERARRENEGEGAEALRRLEDRIERAKWIPDPEPYDPPPGDPLERLEARIRGDLDDGDQISAERAEAPKTAGRSRPGDASAEPERNRVLGAALEKSLRNRALPGPLRAEVAAKLAELMDRDERPELEEIWELVVFGD